MVEPMLAVPAFARMTARIERSRESHKRHQLKCQRVTPAAADESDAIPMRIWVEKRVPAKIIRLRVSRSPASGDDQSGRELRLSIPCDYSSPLARRRGILMSATDGRGVSEPNGVRMPPLVVILEQLGWRVTNIRGPLGRAEKQIRLNERSQKPIAALELEAEKLKKERANYEDLLKLCLDWVRLRTGLSCRQLSKVAFMEESENEPLDDERGKLAELDRRDETALLWRILWADHRDMVVSVKWPTFESSPPAPETPPGQRRRRTKPQMPLGKVQEHWQTVLASGNRDLIQDYLTLAETKLAERIGCSRNTLRKCEGFQNRGIALREFNRENS